MKIKLVGFKKESKSKPPMPNTTTALVIPSVLSPYWSIYTPVGVALAEMIRENEFVIVTQESENEVE